MGQIKMIGQGFCNTGHRKIKTIGKNVERLVTPICRPEEKNTLNLLLGVQNFQTVTLFSTTYVIRESFIFYNKSASGNVNSM